MTTVRGFRRTCSVDALLASYDVQPDSEKGRAIAEARALGRLVVTLERPAKWDRTATVLHEVAVAPAGAVPGVALIEPTRGAGGRFARAKK